MSIQITRTVISTWKGTPVEKLTEAELREALDWAIGEIERLREAARPRWATSREELQGIPKVCS